MAAVRWQRAIALLCVVSFMLTSCVSLESVAIPSGESPPAPSPVAVGDTVVLVTKTHETKTFKVTAVEPDALLGKGVRVAFADMTRLDLKRYRKGATTAAVLAVTATVLVIGGAIAANDAVHSVFSGH
jgi:hypothetical protein